MTDVSEEMREREKAESVRARENKAESEAYDSEMTCVIADIEALQTSEKIEAET